MHHLDITAFKFPHSYHTTGFYERTHRLYLAVKAEPHYPLEWLQASFGQSFGQEQWRLNWAATKRNRERVKERARK